MLGAVGNNDNRPSLGRQFHFVRRIGTGGFGEVYLAEMSTASGFAEMVAIQLLRGEVSGNENVAERMRDEPRLLGMLQNRTIVQAEDLMSISGRVAGVMDDQTIAIPGPGQPETKKKRRGPRASDIVILLLLLAVTAMVAWTQRMQKDLDHGLVERLDMVLPNSTEVEPPVPEAN